MRVTVSSVFVCLCLFWTCVLSSANASSIRRASREIIEDEISRKEKDKETLVKPYKFGYQIKDKDGNVQHRHEESDADGTRRGSYGYLDANGVYRKVNYVADKNGFRVQEMKSNEPGLEMRKKPADVGVKEEKNFISGSSNNNIASRPPGLGSDELSIQKHLNNQKIRGGNFETESRPSNAILSQPVSFIDNPDFVRNEVLPPEVQVIPPSPKHYMAVAPMRSHDFIPVQDSFPYPFVAKPSMNSYNGLQSSPSMPIYQELRAGIKGGRSHYPFPSIEQHQDRYYPPRTSSPPPATSSSYEKPLPVYPYDPRIPPALQSNSNNRTKTSSSPLPPYGMPLHDPRKYYAPLYPVRPDVNPYRQPQQTSSLSPFTFESTRLKPVNDYGTTTPPTYPSTSSSSGYMHPLPVRHDDHYRPSYGSTPNRPPPDYGPIPNGLDYPSRPSSKQDYPYHPQGQLPPPPFYGTVTTSRPYVTYPPLPPPQSPYPPHTESSLDRPLQYLDGPGPGAIVGNSRMQPTVFYADEPPVDPEKLAREVYNYVPDSRSGEPPTPPSSYGFSPPDRIESSPILFPKEDNGRDKLASYYHSIRHSPGISTTVKSTDDVPSVLLGIQSALGLEGVPSRNTNSSPNDLDSNYSPSHYPSYDQIVLLRKGLRKLIPILAKQSSPSSKSSKLSVSSSVRVEKKVPSSSSSVQNFPSLLMTTSSTTTRPSVEEASLDSPSVYQS